MAFNRIGVSAVMERRVVAVGHLGYECYDRECCKQMYVLLCYSSGTNLFRLSEGFEVRLDNSPLFEKGFPHELVR